VLDSSRCTPELVLRDASARAGACVATGMAVPRVSFLFEGTVDAADAAAATAGDDGVSGRTGMTAGACALCAW
jgi:hypothetical protein